MELVNRSGESLSKEAVWDFVSTYSDCFGLVIVTHSHVFAVTDHVRGFPIYFSCRNSEFIVGSDARAVREKAGLADQNRQSVEDYLQAGYVHGRGTLYKDLFVLQAGECLTLERRSGRLEIDSVFSYEPIGGNADHEDTRLRDFGEILDDVFLDLVVSLGSRPIFVPLSGGLDSRLVACKLLEHGATDVRTFTYGSPRSHEMARAKRVAARLGLEWIPIPSRKRGHKDLYDSKMRRDYSDYADGLHMTPVLLDFEAIYQLRKNDLIPPDSVIVNGYSGDFLFGGHIPSVLVSEPSVRKLVECFVEKNYANFTTLKAQALKERKSEELRSLLGDGSFELGTAEHVCGLYEHWDWRERQTKAVVNGQRLYEFFNLDWRLPLWDKRLVKFWATMPLKSKLDQSLHIKYLKHWNYCQAFSTLRSVNQAWPGAWQILRVIGAVIGGIAGAKAKEEFYEFMFYRSYFHYQLALFGRRTYNNWYKFTRRPRVIPLASIHRLDELGIDWRSVILDE